MVGRRVNRKNNGFIFPKSLAAVLAVMGVLALSYLWLCGRCEAMAGELKRLEERRVETRSRRANEEYKWSHLCTLKKVQAQLEAFGCPMALADERCTIRLARPLEIPEVHAREPDVAGVARRPGSGSYD
jgi:hypothetical protein